MNGLKYIGNGNWVYGVPARDLAHVEVIEHGGYIKLLNSGLYVKLEKIGKPNKMESGPKENKQEGE